MATITTKHDLGQQVWPIRASYMSRIVSCNICNRTGRVTISSEELVCPKCKGDSRYTQPAGEKWWCERPSTVGQIRTEHSTHEHYKPDEITYMLDSTGVGSGQVWKECDLFASEAEAEAECERRNAGKMFSDDE